MRPVLYGKNETVFTTNGIGRLNPSYCVVEEERNGSYEAELKISKDDKYYRDIELGSKIKLLVSDGTYQIFIVYGIEKALNDEIEIKCQHISYNLSFIPIRLYSANSASEALQKITTNSMVSNPFSFDTDIISNIAFEPKTPGSAKSYLASILDLYSGEYKFNNEDVYLYQERGIDSGITVRYGKNVTDIEDEITNEDTIDGLVPYWTDGSLTVIGDILRVNNGDRIITEDVSSEISLEEGETSPTLSQVNQAGSKVLLTKVTGSEETIKVSYYQNPDIVDVHLCDYVNVLYEPYNISAKIKVVRTKWNVLKEKYESVELGEIKSFEKTISGITQTINSLNYDNGITQIRLERTEDGIEAEVTRATTQEGLLSTQIGITAEGLTSEVSRATREEGRLDSKIIQTAGEIRLEVSQDIGDAIDDYDQTVNGYLTLYVAKDDNNQVVSMIEAASDYINFTANNMFTVTSQNFSVDHNGNIAAVGAELNDSVTFNAFNPSTGEYDDPKGYIGIVTYGLGFGFGMRNNSNTVGIVMPEGTSYDWLWMGANNKSINFTGDELQPWSSGVNLGSNYHKWNWVVCDNISCTNAPWSSSDKRMKDVHGTINKVREFYMALEPLKYTFKKGVDNENPNKMHYGLIAQDVLKTYEKCYNSDEQGIVKKQKIIDEGTIKVIGEDEKYVINYDELHAFHIAMIQDLQAQIVSLKSEIESLRKEIKK